MTVRELRKKLEEFYPDAVVMIGKNKDGFQDLYDIGRFTYLAPYQNPWCAKYVAILRKEEDEEENV